MEDFEKQAGVAEQIDKLWSNYKKDSADRKTKTYLEKKITQLKELYNKFVKADEQLKPELGKLDDNHPYLITRKAVAENYTKIISELRAKLNASPPVTPVLERKRPHFQPPESDETSQRSVTPTIGHRIPETETKQKDPELEKSIKRQQIRMRNLYRKIDEADDIMRTGTKAAMELSLTSTQKLMDQITELHEEICMLVSEEEEEGLKYSQDRYFENIDERCQAMMLQMTTAIEERQISKQSTKTTDIRLPRIQIPTFSGDYQKWTGFRDTFSKLIHENPQISNTHKINYLKGQLEGDASKLISHLQPTEDNYEAAWEILNKRYNNRRLLISTYLNTLFGLQSINSESAAALRNLHDTTTECLYAIRNAGVNTESWNSIIIFTLCKKLDSESRRYYESSLKDPREFQSTTEFLKFLEGRFKSLEATSNQRTTVTSTSSTAAQQAKTQIVKRAFVTRATICVYCRKGHNINSCRGFINLSSSERSQVVMLHNLCRNCLDSQHETRACKQNNQCAICNGKHNSALHINNNSDMQKVSKSYVTTQLGPVIIPTAIIALTTSEGNRMLFRALIDPGSQASFITTRAANQLKARQKQVNIKISGMGGKEAGVCSHKVELTLSSRLQSSFKIKFEAMVFKKLTDNVPDIDFDTSKWAHLQHLQLADPQYNKCNSIDVIIGVDYYPMIINNNIIKGYPQDPIAQETELGWIIMGSTGYNQENNRVSMVTTKTIGQQLELFIENESTADCQTQRKEHTDEEVVAEKLFTDTTERLSDGKYMVHLPFKEHPSMLGESRKKAVARLLQIERRFARDKPFAKLYHEFMEDYLKRGHMQLITDGLGEGPKYYIPHHGVINHESTTTKLRVVFDASSKTSSGLSLNDIMMNGPKLQSDLIDIILRWRTHKFVLTADVEKMFRQIWMKKEHQNLQRILWRKNPVHPIEEYQLKTVTYGTTAATFLAVRTLMQLARDEKNNYPIAAKIMETDFYVDDLLTGGDSISEVINIQQQIAGLASSGGFPMHKWASNSAEILTQVPEHLQAKGMISLKINDIIKTLGILYNPERDTFEFDMSRLKLSEEEPTKRLLLSDSSKLFDPVGWLSPITISAKLLMQETWKANIDWDDSLPKAIGQKWEKYKAELGEIGKIKLPRWVNTSPNKILQLHGFADASQQAYAAVVYLKTTNELEQITTSLLVAKTRVAPVKRILTVPKLELNAAHLLSRLLAYVKTTLNYKEVEVFAWTDSTIVLSWMRNDVTKLETFIANRVSQIRAYLPEVKWNYVPTDKNPADLATRYSTAHNITEQCSIWWTGPGFLRENSNAWPSDPSLDDSLLRENILSDNEITCLSVTTRVKINPLHGLIDKISNIHKLKRIFVYCQRFINRHVHKGQPQFKEITVSELKLAEIQIIRIEQHRYFHDEIQALNRGTTVNTKSNLFALHPFIDQDGILRLRGRLQKSQLTTNQKLPIILPKESKVSKRIVEDVHKTTTLHGGIQLTLANIRNKFWIINGRNMVRNVIHKCISCFRHNHKTLNQLMGDLPVCRVTPSRPFSKVGLDYAGPILLKNKIGRGQSTYKGYIAVFVCMATKAIHIEVVSGLTTEGFIAAYRRFTSRRGLCTEVYSDNGTNFVGAYREVAQLLQRDETTWHFIPPAAPHFGGIWEAGVKSIKNHMKKVIGETALTFEEATTITTQIEACLNSRPLTTLYDDPDSLEILTPAHFLIGGPMKTIPTTNGGSYSLRTRWHLVQRIVDDFWKRWSIDYLHQLQQRSKWRTPQPNLAVGDMVLVKEDSLPPARWKMGRVQEVHMGSDGLVRVASIKSNQNIYKRPITKLCKLPNEPDSSSIQPKDNQNEDQGPISTTDNINTPTRRITRSMKVFHCAIEADTKSLINKRTYSGRKDRPMKLGALVKAIMFIIILSRAHLTKATIDKVHIQQIKQPIGVFLEDIGQVDVVAMDWNLIIRYKLTNYWEEIKQVNIIHTELAEACNKTLGINCALILHQLEWQLGVIQKNNEFLMSSNKERLRKRRGIGDSTGILLGDIFGILTQREASQYEDHFDTIDKNERHLIDLLSNQTSIIDNTIKLFKHNSNLTMMSLNHFKESQIRMQKEIDLLKEYATIEEKIRGVFITTLEMMLMVSNIKETQQSLLDLVHNAQQNTLHPTLLTPSQLEQEMSKIRKHLPPSITTLNDHTVDNLEHIYKTMTLKTRITKDNLIIRATIPLIYSWSYTLFSVIQFPNIYHNGFQAYIETTTNYIAVDKQREHYASITKDMLSDCQEVKANHFLCKLSQIYNVPTKEHACEMSILRHTTNLQGVCNIKTINATNHWIRLHATNQWLFIVVEETHIDAICGSSIITTTFNGSGILTLDDGCMLRDATVYLIATNRMNSEIRGQINTPILVKHNNFTNLISSPNWHTANNNTSHGKKEEFIDLAIDTTNLERDIRILKENQYIYEANNTHHIHHYVLIHILFWSGTIIAIVTLIKCLKNKHNRRRSTQRGPLPVSSPVPAPRCRSP